MAADRQRLAAALAYEEERRRRMMESVPVIDDSAPTTEPRRSLRSDLENLSSGLGQAGVNILEGGKALLTDPIGTVKGTYETVKGVVRDPSLIADALRYTADKAMSGPLGAGEVIGEMVNPVRFLRTPVMQEIDVYHGSPHRFEEFDASKIGTGEGAQAYGHGIYLAESPDVARTYIPKGRDLSGFTLRETGEFIGKDDPRFPEIADTMDRMIKNGYGERFSEQFSTHGGALYTADLPDEMVDRMLDWDKPLSEQSPAVRETVMRYMNVGEKQLPPDMRVGQIGDKYVVLQDKPPLPGSTFGVGRSIVKGPRAASEQEAVAAYWNSLTGKDFYDTLGNDLGQNADASDYMRQLGIPGIKYLDAGSRGQGGGGTRNFVVFPGEEKKVKILRRE